jgi:hypothetical protein
MHRTHANIQESVCTWCCFTHLHARLRSAGVRAHGRCTQVYGTSKYALDTLECGECLDIGEELLRHAAPVVQQPEVCARPGVHATGA